MRKQQEQSKLRLLVNDTQIYNSIVEMEHLLSRYHPLKRGDNKPYDMQRELALLRKEISELKNRINEIVDQSTKWEALE